MSSEIATKGPAKGAEMIANLIRGAEKACREYIAMSGLHSPGLAPESFIQAGAARELAKIGQTWVVLEGSVADTFNAARPVTPGRVKAVVSKGRYDIVAYWQSGKPRAAIEVKSPVNAMVRQKFDKDFTRLIETMNGHPDASFQYGIFLFLTVKKSANTDFSKAKCDIDALVEKLKIEALAMSREKAKKKINVYQYDGKSYPLETGDTQGAWRISALVFKR